MPSVVYSLCINILLVCLASQAKFWMSEWELRKELEFVVFERICFINKDSNKVNGKMGQICFNNHLFITYREKKTLKTLMITYDGGYGEGEKWFGKA